MANKDYGLKIRDAVGNVTTITSEVGTVISMGRVTMPTGLVDTNKYYVTIALPDSIDFNNLVVLAQPVVWVARAIQLHLVDTPYRYLYRYCLYNSYTYYSKVPSTGVMSTLTVGARTVGTYPTYASEWWGVMAAFPVVYWEKLGATSGNTIKIFAATCYCYGDNPSDADTYIESNKWAYTISTNGVSQIDYMILNKRFNY